MIIKINFIKVLFEAYETYILLAWYKICQNTGSEYRLLLGPDK